jgi:hypothetical protein
VTQPSEGGVCFEVSQNQVLPHHPITPRVVWGFKGRIEISYNKTCQKKNPILSVFSFLQTMLCLNKMSSPHRATNRSKKNSKMKQGWLFSLKVRPTKAQDKGLVFCKKQKKITPYLKTATQIPKGLSEQKNELPT